MADELRNLNFPMAEQQVIMKILQTIPPSLRPFLSAWQSVPPGEQTINNLTTRPIGEEIMNNESNEGESDPADNAFFASRTTQPPQRNGRFDQGMGIKRKSR